MILRPTAALEAGTCADTLRRILQPNVMSASHWPRSQTLSSFISSLGASLERERGVDDADLIWHPQAVTNTPGTLSSVLVKACISIPLPKACGQKSSLSSNGLYARSFG